MAQSVKQYKQEQALRAVQTAAISGFPEENRSLQESCLVVCNSCRECVPWPYLRVDLELPSTLFALFWPDIVCEVGGRASRVVLPRNVVRVGWSFQDPERVTCFADGARESGGVGVEEGGEEDKVEETEVVEEEEEEELEEGGHQTNNMKGNNVEEGDEEKELEEERQGLEEKEGEKEGGEKATKEDSGEQSPVTAWDIDMSKVRWPEGVKTLYLWGFNRPIDVVAWPASLEVFSFHMPFSAFEKSSYIYGRSGIFNRFLDRVTFPAGLRDLSLGNRFNQPVDGVCWPKGLQRLSMPAFDHPIKDVQWPVGLKKLDFMEPQQFELQDSSEEISWDRQYVGFDQPLGTFLPKILEKLWLSHRFNQPLRGVTWPSGLTVLGLGTLAGRESIKGVEWPPSLRKLVSRSSLNVEGVPPHCKLSSFTSVSGNDESDPDDDIIEIDSSSDVDDDDSSGNSSVGDFTL